MEKRTERCPSWNSGQVSAPSQLAGGGSAQTRSPKQNSQRESEELKDGMGNDDVAKSEERRMKRNVANETAEFIQQFVIILDVQEEEKEAEEGGKGTHRTGLDKPL